MADKKEKSIIKNAFYSFVKSFMTLIFPLITFPYASRILLPEGIGKINFANSIVTYFIIIAELGITKYATREASRLRNDNDKLTKFCKEIFTINMISTAISYTLFFIACFNIPKLKEYRVLLFVCSGKIFFMTVGIDWFFRAIEEFKYITIRSIIFQFISLIFLFMFVKTKDDYVEYAIFGMISSVGSNICNIFYARHFINLNAKIKLELKKHLKYVFTFFGMSLITSVYEILDTSMLGFLSNDTQVGLYSAGIKINKMTVEVIIAISAVFLPRFSIYFNEDDKEHFNSLAINGFMFITMIGLPMIAGLFLLSEPFVRLFCGPEYLEAVPLMKIITPILLFLALSNFMGAQILPAINKEKVSMISYICAATVNITLNFIFIPKYGAIGAAIGTVFAEGMEMIFQLFYLHKLFFIKKIFVNFIQTIIATIVMFFGIKFLMSIISNYVIQLLVCISTGIIIYFLVLLLFRNKVLGMFLEKIKNKFSKKFEK